MDFIDTHCHLDSILSKLGLTEYADLKSRYFPSNFGGCISIACDAQAFGPLRKLMRNEGVYGAFGIHPHDAKHYSADIEAELSLAMADTRTVAWGEIGLDYHYDFSERPMQRNAFEKQLLQAVAAAKPVVIHTREAEEDTLALMAANLPKDWKIHVHCFTSSPGMAEKLLADFPNLCLGFTGIITFKNALELQEVVKATPTSRILLETDGPYLAPVPHRGKPAHPGHIPLIAQKVAELQGKSVDEIYSEARANTRRIFGI